jgi:hypothetical protein
MPLRPTRSRQPLPRFRRVSQPFFAAALRFSADCDEPPLRPPFFAEALLSFRPRPDPDLLPPPDSLLTVA